MDDLNNTPGMRFLNMRPKWPWFDCQSSPTGAGRLQVRFCFKFDRFFCAMAHPNRYMFADPMNPDDKTGLLVTVWLWPKVSIEGFMSSWILQFSLRSAPNYCYRCGNVGPQMVEMCFNQPFNIDTSGKWQGRFNPGYWWAGSEGVTLAMLLVETSWCTVNRIFICEFTQSLCPGSASFRKFRHQLLQCLGVYPNFMDLWIFVGLTGECLVKRVCSSGQWSVLRCRLVSWCPTSCDASTTSHWDGKEWVEQLPNM